MSDNIIKAQPNKYNLLLTEYNTVNNIIFNPPTLAKNTEIVC